MQKKLEIGVASSMFQTSGNRCGTSNWTEAAKNGTVPDATQLRAHWDNFESDLDIIQQTGAGSYRFSIEWSHIEPEQGKYNQEVIDRYKKLVNECLKRKIKPMITLYHFNEPLWFSKLGSFEREENIVHFTNFCKRVFPEFSDKVSLWCTINEPAVQAFMGYTLGDFPPHRKGNFIMAATVLKNMLKAHVEVYHELKKLSFGNRAEIGIVHNVLRFKPLLSWDPIAYALTNLFNPITNTLVMNFFKTGVFDYSTTFSGRVHYEDQRATKANDFFGLNFYANPIVGPNFQTGYGATCRTGSEMGDMYLPIDPEGFAEAIDQVADLGFPIYITETGIADKSDTLRQKLVPLYLNVVRDKVAKGINIKGTYFWTVWDNYEWNQGNSKSFGFFNADRQPRGSVKVLKELIDAENNLPNDKSANIF